VGAMWLAGMATVSAMLCACGSGGNDACVCVCDTQ
jgi:hypothetical protein